MRTAFLKIVFILLAGYSGFAQELNPDFTEKIARHDKSVYLKKQSFSESAYYFVYDLVYQRMEWKIDPAVHYISGAITSHFISKTNGLKEIDFDLHDSLKVDSVYQRMQPVTFTHSENKLNIQLKQPLNESEIDSITVFYQGRPPASYEGFGSFATSRRGKNPGVPVMWTLSEPYGAM